MGASKGDALMSLSYRIQLIPTSRPQRPGYRIVGGRPSSLTEHNIGAENSTASQNANYFCNNNLSASAHIFVDDKEAVLTIPLNEQAWSTGTKAGNTTTASIETCEFTDPVRAAAAERNTQILIADMLTGRAPAGFQTPHLKLTDVRTHQSWSGKYCPRDILPHWGEFIAGIAALMAPTVAQVAPPEYAVYMVYAPTVVAIRDYVAPAVAKGFAATLTAVGPSRQLPESLDNVDALAYPLVHGRSAVEMFDAIGDTAHSVVAIQAPRSYGDIFIKAAAKKAGLAENDRTCGTTATGYKELTAALTHLLEVGVDFPAVFGKA